MYCPHESKGHVWSRAPGLSARLPAGLLGWHRCLLQTRSKQGDGRTALPFTLHSCTGSALPKWLVLGRGPVREQVPGRAAKAAAALSLHSSHCSSAVPEQLWSPAALPLLSSPAVLVQLQPALGFGPRVATPCRAVVSAGPGQAAGLGEVRHSVCCLIIAGARARSRAHTNSAGLR